MKFYILLGIAALASAENFFVENFDEGCESRWVTSEHKKDYGKFVVSSGKFYNDAEEDKGFQTSQDAKFYADSSKFTSFSNEGKTLVVQFSVKHEQTIDCGGGYVKLFPSTQEQTDMHGESQYNIMFGPDICGPGTKKVHVIFNYKGKNLLVKRDIRCKDDEYTHIYTLIVKPDNTYEVLIDNKSAQSGELEADWDFLPSKQIKDPEAKKPSQEEWDEREKIDDPEASKPEDYDQPEHIPDSDATQPEDWDEEMDGEWEAPMIDNPEYKGEWKAEQITNPDYKGKWVHPMIDNPEYEADDELYKYDDFGVIGLDLWQVKSGTIFDNFLITDDLKAASDAAEEIMKRVDGEKEMKAKQEEEEKAKQAEEDGAEEDEDDEDLGTLEEDEEEDVEEDEEAPAEEEQDATEEEENVKDEL